MMALILCAGLGTRLRPITNKIPKPMVEVGGKPVLRHLVDHLKKYGINEIIVNLHYKPNKIMKNFGTELIYFYERDLLGEARTILALRKWLASKDSFFVMNGDTLTDLDLNKMIEISKNYNNATVVSVDKGKYTGTSLISSANPETITANFNCYWQDIGTPAGLRKARKHYEKLSDLS